MAKQATPAKPGVGPFPTSAEQTTRLTLTNLAYDAVIAAAKAVVADAEDDGEHVRDLAQLTEVLAAYNLAVELYYASPK